MCPNRVSIAARLSVSFRTIGVDMCPNSVSIASLRYEPTKSESIVTFRRRFRHPSELHFFASLREIIEFGCGFVALCESIVCSKNLKAEATR